PTCQNMKKLKKIRIYFLFLVLTSLFIIFLMLRDGRVCLDPLRLNSNLDYLLLGATDIRRGEGEFNPISEVTSVVGSADRTQNKIFPAIVVNSDRGRNFAFISGRRPFKGKELSFFTLDRGVFYALYSPCGKKLLSTE
ncbi:MAG: hypothetical protein RIA63_01655, partial [Cyclobacteriaceae bacterium]